MRGAYAVAVTLQGTLWPSSLRTRYAEAVRRLWTAGAPARPAVTDADLDRFPEVLQRHLRRVGVVGRPPVGRVRARFRSEIRGGPREAWMPGTAEQVESFRPVERLFFMKARRQGLPVHVFHRFVGSEASMEVRLLGLLPVLDVRGPELTRSETVTALNDLFMLAPSALVEAPIQWEPVDERRVRATFQNGDHTVSAIVVFDETGDLVDFRSDDRSRFDGSEHRRERWSTPVRSHGEFRGVRLPREAEAWWGRGDDAWCYARFTLREVDSDR